jgi:hypothetical protein
MKTTHFGFPLTIPQRERGFERWLGAETLACAAGWYFLKQYN